MKTPQETYHEYVEAPRIAEVTLSIVELERQRDLYGMDSANAALVSEVNGELVQARAELSRLCNKQPKGGDAVIPSYSHFDEHGNITSGPGSECDRSGTAPSPSANEIERLTKERDEISRRHNDLVIRAETAEFALMEAQAETGKLLSVIKQGVMCEAEDKMIPLTIEDDSDPSAGLFGCLYLVLPDGYEVVPTGELAKANARIAELEASARDALSALIEAAELAEREASSYEATANNSFVQDEKDQYRGKARVLERFAEKLRIRADDMSAPSADGSGAGS